MNELEQLIERKWDLTDELAAINLAIAALMNRIKDRE